MDFSFTTADGTLVEFYCKATSDGGWFSHAVSYDDEHQPLVDAYYAEHEEDLHEQGYEEGAIRRFSNGEMYA